MGHKHRASTDNSSPRSIGSLACQQVPPRVFPNQLNIRTVYLASLRSQVVVPGGPEPKSVLAHPYPRHRSKFCHDQKERLAVALAIET
jgi:hypothetical protein